VNPNPSNNDAFLIGDLSRHYHKRLSIAGAVYLRRNLWVCVLQIPLPTGEGAAKRRVRGTKNEDTLKKYLWYPSPDPLARVTLSRRERDLPKTFRTCRHFKTEGYPHFAAAGAGK
jgi:hypothetical protein